MTLPGNGDYDLNVGFTDPLNQSGATTTPIDVGYSTTPPADPVGLVIEDANGKDLSSGGGTNVNPVTFKGDGKEGDTVIIRDADGKELGSVVIGAGGDWSIPVTLPDTGDMDVSVVYKDEYGNVSNPTPSIEIGYSTAKPNAPEDVNIVDGNGQDLAAGGNTNNSPLTFSGKGTAGDIVYIYDGSSKIIGSEVVDEKGEWSLEITLPSDDDYSFEVGFENKYGNSGDKSTPISIVYDTLPPPAPTGITISDGVNDLSSGGLTNRKDLTFTGTAEREGDIVSIYNGATIIGSVIAGPGGDWSLSVSLDKDDNYDLKVGYKDAANNESIQTTGVSVELDTTVIAPADVSLDFSSGTAELIGAVGSVEPNATVYIYRDKVVVGSVTAEADGSWNWKQPPGLANNSYEYYATQKDVAQNTSSESNSLNYKLDSTTWTFTDPSDPGWSVGKGYTPTYSGQFRTGYFYAGTNPTAGDNVFAGDVLYRNVDLIKGETYTFSFTAKRENGAGNATAILGVKLDGNTILVGKTLSDSGNDVVYTITFVATSDGPAKLAITNDYNRGTGNDFSLKDLVFQHHEETPTITAVITSYSNDYFDLTGHDLVLKTDEAVLDLNKAVEQLQDINTVSLNGHGANTLNVSINDVLTLGKEDLFIKDGSKQLMINGDKEDTVNLQSIAGDKGIENWNAHGEVTVGGAVYNLYQSDNQEVELLIQQGIQIQQH